MESVHQVEKNVVGMRGFFGRSLEYLPVGGGVVVVVVIVIKKKAGIFRGFVVFYPT